MIIAFQPAYPTKNPKTYTQRATVLYPEYGGSFYTKKLFAIFCFAKNIFTLNFFKVDI